jgi:osmoprotectant transport system substrate-binding protein
MTKRGAPVLRSRFRLLVAVVAALALLVAACGDDDTTETGDTETTDGVPTDADGDDGADADDGDGDGAQATFEFVPLDAGGPQTKSALSNGDVDIALLFSSDGAIVANDWVALDDDEDLQPVDNFVPAVNTDVADEVAEVIDAVSAELTVEAMQEAVAAVSIEGENPADAAGAFLADADLPDADLSDVSVRVGSANFAESEITAELYAQALEAAGASVDRQLQFGARETYIPALEAGELDIVPEFVGTLTTFLGGEATSDLDETLDDGRSLAEERGFTLLEPADADSVNTFVVTSETADEYGLSTVSDLAGVPDPLRLGGPPECPERPFCLLGLIEVYGLEFEE